MSTAAPWFMLLLRADGLTEARRCRKKFLGIGFKRTAILAGLEIVGAAAIHRGDGSIAGSKGSAADGIEQASGAIAGSWWHCVAGVVLVMARRRPHATSATHPAHARHEEKGSDSEHNPKPVL
jgi:hypothetical protein